MSESPPAYRVLARKYRSQRFSELIGQDAMVRTLANAIARGRLAHAFLLTGVRGVGKTSTARLIAKALNCTGPDGEGGPTIDPCGVCESCVAIAEGRHIDVVEMDAASHTGVDDVREIIEAVRYAAVSARYKVYIIDEVHMLSKNAFNALLKTLEEPPAHVKFLFATTEVNKVPVTVLSRCQRFDLRRIPADKLAAHFAWIVEQEQVEAEAEALALIARAAEGSARDGLSILDQAIAHGTGVVTAEQVRQMLGLSDRGAVRRLFGHLLAGDASAVLAAFTEQHDLGVDPGALLHGLLETCHAVTRMKAGGGDDPAMSAEERQAITDWAQRLSFTVLHRLWQLLLKGHGEVQAAAMPREAAEMALLRIVHAQQLPDPGELMRRIANGELAAAAPVAGGDTAPAEVQQPLLKMPGDFPALIDALDAAGARRVALKLRDYGRLSSYAPPEIALARHDAFDAEFLRLFKDAAKSLTGQTWNIAFVDGPAEPSLHEREQASETARREEVLAMPVVRAAFEAFAGAELLGYTDPDPSIPAERSARA
jgi:DNA polymerase-3 subunit gamma/tau